MLSLVRVAALAGGQSCRGCRRPGSALCRVCASSATPAAGDSLLGVDRMLARWAHEGVPRDLVLDLKVRGVRSAAEPLASGLVELVRREGCRGRVVTWVPGRTPGIRLRGFDHAEVIARLVAADLGLPVAPLLFHRRATADQTGLSRVDRRLNLDGAFSSRPIRGWVVLVDDVVTSGATAEACARALEKAGCDGVELLAACRA